MNTKIVVLTVFVCFVNLLFGQQKNTEDTFRVAFYNVENLFDTVDDPIKIDEAFTPDGSKKWTKERYDKKLEKLAQVIDALGKPGILGICEIENKAVLSDLAQTKAIRDVHYDVVHFESPDVRGIDVGLLFDTDVFSLKSSDFIRVDFPLWLEADGYTSRDILHVELTNKTNDIFHVFVNHWPSRRGGQAASEKRRLWVATHLRKAVNEVMMNTAGAKIIIIGDFNDEASNRSLSHALGTLPIADNTVLLPDLLYNPFLTLEKAGEGSYNYKGDWNMLDQVVFAGFDQTSNWKMTDYGILKEDWLLYKGEAPSKTYGGPNYYGGYSDHLPVFMDFGRKTHPKK